VSRKEIEGREERGGENEGGRECDISPLVSHAITPLASEGISMLRSVAWRLGREFRKGRRIVSFDEKLTEIRMAAVFLFILSACGLRLWLRIAFLGPEQTSHCRRATADK
jgi:hypothetical protein